MDWGVWLEYKWDREDEGGWKVGDFVLDVLDLFWLLIWVCC